MFINYLILSESAKNNCWINTKMKFPAFTRIFHERKKICFTNFKKPNLSWKIKLRPCSSCTLLNLRLPNHNYTFLRLWCCGSVEKRYRVELWILMIGWRKRRRDIVTVNHVQKIWRISDNYTKKSPRESSLLREWWSVYLLVLVNIIYNFKYIAFLFVNRHCKKFICWHLCLCITKWLTTITTCHILVLFIFAGWQEILPDGTCEQRNQLQQGVQRIAKRRGTKSTKCQGIQILHVRLKLFNTWYYFVFSSTMNYIFFVQTRPREKGIVAAKFNSSPAIGSANNRLDPIPNSPVHDSSFSTARPLPPMKKFVK